MKHGNKLIALLVLVLFCMMSFLPGAVFAAEGDASANTEDVEKNKGEND